MKDIFDECQFGDFKLKSRVVRTGNWETQNDFAGFLDTDVFKRYDEIAGSGVGLIISEMFVLDKRDRFDEFSANLTYKGFIKDYKEITTICHSYKVPILGQLAFFFYNDGLNHKIEANDISVEGIRRLQAEVIMAAKKMSYAGFDGIQINMGNNFYLSRFTNPYFNQRTDKYGGNTENRMRIVTEIIKATKKNYDMHVSCRINPYDGRKGGVTAEESIKMAKLLEEAGADSIQITARTISFAESKDKTHPFMGYITKLLDEVNIPVILGGTLRDSETMNKILNSTDLELLSMSKPFVAQHDFLKEWKEQGGGVSICQSCNNCYGKKTSTCFKY